MQSRRKEKSVFRMVSILVLVGIPDDVDCNNFVEVKDDLTGARDMLTAALNYDQRT